MRIKQWEENGDLYFSLSSRGGAFFTFTYNPAVDDGPVCVARRERGDLISVPVPEEVWEAAEDVAASFRKEGENNG